MKSSIRQNLILFIASAVTLVLAFILGLNLTMPSVIALEQNTRCGMTEHVHTDECYLNNILICGEKAHTHGGNCYLLRLEDNDINRLLSEIDASETKSLEHVITNVVYEASYLELVSEGVLPAPTPTPTPTPTPLAELLPEGSSLETLTETNADIVRLNQTIVENDITPALYLNETLDTAVSSGEGYSEQDALTYLATGETGNGGISTLAVGDSAGSSANTVYFYIELDGNVTYIDSASFTYNNGNSNNRYYYVITANAVNAYTDNVITDISTSNINDDYYLRYSTSEITDSTDLDDLSTASSYTQGLYLGNRRSGTGARYAILTTRSGNSWNYTYTAVPFYTVTLDYSAVDTTKANDVRYVQSGQSSGLTLSDEYEWYTTEDGNTAGTLPSTITSTTTLYARPKGYTVTFDSNGGSDVASQIVSRTNGKAAEPAEPTMAGHTFGGWYTDNGTFNAPYDFDTVVSGNLTLYAKWTINRYTVTFDSDGGSYTPDSQTVNYNAAAEEPAAPTREHSTFLGWYTADGEKFDFATDTVTENITLTAKWETEKHTVTFNSNGGTAAASQTVEHGSTATSPANPTKEGHTFAGWYTDNGTFNNAYDFNAPVTGNITLYAKWTANNYTVTYIDGDTTKTAIYPYGAVIELPDTADSGAKWYDGAASYSPGDSYTVTGNVTFTATTKLMVTYVYANGTTGTEEVIPGGTVTLPNPGTGNVWVDGGGSQYKSGDVVTITRNTTFTAAEYLNISYAVNFPTSANISGTTYAGDCEITMPASPTLEGLTVTSKSDDTAAEGTTTELRNLSQREVIAETNQAAGFKYCFYFEGWLTESGNIIPPGTKLSYEQLSAYDEDGDGTVELTGQWDDGTLAVANFCIHLDSLLTSGGGTNNYTKSLFATYVGGDGTIAAGNADYTATKETLVAVDERIRALHGAVDEDIWFYNFPTDEYIFGKIAEEIGDGAQLTVEGEDVLVRNLNPEYYTVRWSAMFSSSWESWHVDGVLVHKTGNITVSKEFYGDDAAIDEAKKDFYIVAENGTMTNGVFTPYASTANNFKQYVLTFDTGTTSTAIENEIAASYPNAEIIRQDGDGTEFTGTIENVRLGEYWRISEHAEGVTVSGTDYIYYSEYSIWDTDGEVTAIAEFGTTASVVGKTFNLDEDPDQGLMVDFSNYYYPSDSMFIKKEDGETGQAIGGAIFELWQYNSDGELAPLKFSVDAAGNYSFDESGTITRIVTGTDGFTSVVVNNFSYDHGDVVVKEVSAPAGYDKAPNVRISNDKGQSAAAYIADVCYDSGDTTISAAEYGKYAEVEENGSVVVVKDYSTKKTALTVTKEWDGATTAGSVTVVLQANGTTATNIFPNMTGITAVLDATGGYTATDANGAPVYEAGSTPWTYTWTNLPVYANGAEVEWSVKEIMVGDEITTTDGETFVNWIVSYSAPTKTDADSDGITDNWAYTVTNTVRRPMLRLTKVDGSGAALSGAGFTLTEVTVRSGSWSEGTSLSGTTDSSGVITFDNLTAGSYYKLSETSVPSGFWPVEAVYITIDGSGVVKLATLSGGAVTETVLSGTNHQYTNPNNIRVINLSSEPLPETGGPGTGIYTLGGLLLMAAATALLIYRKRHRKEDGLLDV